MNIEAVSRYDSTGDSHVRLDCDGKHVWIALHRDELDMLGHPQAASDNPRFDAVNRRCAYAAAEHEARYRTMEPQPVADAPSDAARADSAFHEAVDSDEQRPFLAELAQLVLDLYDNGALK